MAGEERSLSAKGDHESDLLIGGGLISVAGDHEDAFVTGGTLDGVSSSSSVLLSDPSLPLAPRPSIDE